MDVGFSYLSLLLMPLFSSFATLPLAGPPLPLDPVLSAIAPEQCLFYLSSSGVAQPDPASPNQTEQLFAEAEVRYFSTEIQKQVLDAIRKSAGSSREEQVLASELPKLVKALMTLPMAAFVEDFRVLADATELQAGLVFRAGDQRQALEAAIQKLVDLVPEDGTIVTVKDGQGKPWRTWRVSMQTPEIRWGWHDDYFVLAVGQDDRSVQKILDRMQGAAPAWLDSLRSKQKIERESSLGYLNVGLLHDRLQPLLSNEHAWEIVEKLELTSIKSAHCITGFDEQGCVSRSHLETDGRREGLLSLLPYKPLSNDDLERIPRDAMLAVAKRVDGEEVWENFLRIVEKLSPQAGEKIAENLRIVEAKLGVDMEKDILGSLDDVWTAHLPSGDLMTSWLGSVVQCKVKDADRLQQAIKILIADLQAKLPPSQALKISASEFEGQTVYIVKFPKQSIPVTPTWCVTDDWFIIGLTPQTVRGAITRASSEQPKDSLAEVPEVRQAFSSHHSPSVLTYCDTPKFARSLYPLVQIGAQMLSSQLAQEGIEFDASVLPSQDAIVGHLRPSVSLLSHQQDGFHFHSRHSLPGGSSPLVLAPLAMGTVSSYSMSRPRSRANPGLNKMKHIALAFHNYVASHRKIPTNIYDENGNALLSWRVRLLPYIEQGADLSEQFHLDEPWDSPHNLPLSEKMPALFASLDHPELQRQGKTCYLAFAGEETLFPGDQRLSFKQVTDGTSQTIMFVKADRNAAVVWSRPRDIDFDAKAPFRGLDSSKGQISVALTDGSCRRLKRTIGDAMMKALATRAGGEMIEPAVWNR